MVQVFVTPAPHPTRVLIYFFCIPDTPRYRHEHLGLRGPNTAAEHGKLTAGVPYTAGFNGCHSNPSINFDDTPLFHFTADTINFIVPNFLVIRDLILVFDFFLICDFHRVVADGFIDPIFVHF